MFCDANARAGDDESGGCRDVESAAGVAAGAAGVDEDFIGGAAAGAGGEERSGVTAHDGGEADEFVDGFAFEAQRGEKAGDLGVGGLAGENLLHGGFGFGAGEIVAGDDFFEGVVEGGGGSLRGDCVVDAAGRSCRGLARAARAAEMFAGVIRADVVHHGGAARAIGAFEGADGRFGVMGEGFAAFFAGGAHFERHRLARPRGSR